jgi:hypothetical protein
MSVDVQEEGLNVGINVVFTVFKNPVPVLIHSFVIKL